MLLMVVDVENVLVEFHHTPTASEESVEGGYCTSCALIPAMKFNAYEWKDTPVGFPEQYEIVLHRIILQKTIHCNVIAL